MIDSFKVEYPSRIAGISALPQFTPDEEAEYRLSDSRMMNDYAKLLLTCCILLALTILI